MNNDLNRLEISKNLRDIFLSDNSKELFNAFTNLKKENKTSELELETDFNRYFIGPDTPIASPYASIYLGEEEALMTETTMQVRELYTIMGFKNSLKNTLPEDFLGLELDAYYQLLYIEIEKNIPYLKDLRIYFLQEHIEKWIFLFINKVLESKEENSESIYLMINELNSFFQNELKLKGDLL